VTRQELRKPSWIVPRESTERILIALKAPSAIDSMTTAEREAAHVCLGRILSLAIKRAGVSIRRQAERDRPPPVQPVSYKKVLKLTAQLTDFVGRLEKTSDPPSKFWNTETLADLESWAKMGLEFSDKAGPPMTIDWELAADLTIFYKLILKRKPSGSAIQIESKKGGSLFAPTMRFMLAAFHEAKLHAPEQWRRLLTPPSVASVRLKLIPQLARLEHRSGEKPRFTGIEIDGANARVQKIWARSLAERHRIAAQKP